MKRSRLALVLVALLPLSCQAPPRPLAPRTQTFAELRVVRRGVLVAPPGDRARVPYARERLVDGEEVSLVAGGLAWLRRDGGETLLIAGPAHLVQGKDELRIDEGRVFVDAGVSDAIPIGTPRGTLHLSGVRASLDVSKAGAVEAYVLQGALRAGDGQARAGEQIALGQDGHATVAPVTVWEDWTGGLATTDQSSQPQPYGVGTVGARPPGSTGQPRRPLSIQKLEVRVTIERDLAITEVEEIFFNPTGETVEGIYSFRVPLGAALHRFGVDRDGAMIWGRVKEKKAAAAQYQAHVYQGSTEDPALLEWDAPGIYKARLYPIAPGATRRVVTRYAEWLGRQGPKAERRLYTYPMAAEGAQSTLPRIEEMTITVDLDRAGAREVRSGMAGTREGNQITVRAHDLTPLADYSLELVDDGAPVLTAYQARHTVDVDTLPHDEREKAVKDGDGERDYVIIPVRPTGANEPPGGIDLAIVVDASAATSTSSLALSRAMTTALLAHLGPNDRVAVWAGDAALRPVTAGSEQFRPVDAALRQGVSEGLARIERGGATDLGVVVAEAARSLDPNRRGAVVYVGDGRPTVGELSLPALRSRLDRLPRPVRLFAVGVGDQADMGILGGIARGGFAERISDGASASRAALRLLGETERPVWLGVSVDLGVGIDRVYPRELGALASDETALIVGRVAGPLPASIKVRGSGGQSVSQLITVPIEDDGDARRRWAEGRLVQLLDEGAGRAALVEVGSRFGIITPVTSLYVPTSQEAREEKAREPQASTETTTIHPQQRGLFDGLFGGKQEAQPTSAAVATAIAYASAAAPVAVAPVATAPQSPPMMGKGGERSRAASGPTRSMPKPSVGAAPGGGTSRSSGSSVDAEDRPAAPAAAAANKPMDELRKNAYGGEIADKSVADGDLIDQGAVPAGSMATTPVMKRVVKADVPDLLPINRKSPLAQQEAVGSKDTSGFVTFATRGASQTTSFEASGQISHRRLLCGAAASLPLDERTALWRERIGAARNSPARLVALYREALRACEAPGWGERSRLLYLLVDAAPGVSPRVELWRQLFDDKVAADLVYRAIVLRLATPEQIRQFHSAVGLRFADPTIIEKTLKDAPDAAARVAKMRGLVAVFPQDLSLAVRLLEVIEDAGDVGATRAYARELRSRGDADARIRTAVGEYFLRSPVKPGHPGEQAEEARRVFGELVEFSPDDPVARRRLGDLFLAHGWYDDAFRQYETLGQLAPQDTSVSLLLAAAAQGTGRVEEAIGWTERASLAASPGVLSGNGRIARALARAFLAWADLDAQKQQQTEDLAQLRERARRLTGLDVPAGAERSLARVLLTWSHPDLHPTLWSSALGAMMPAPDSDPLLGVSQVFVPVEGDRGLIEIRLEPEDAARAARLRLEATLTIIAREGQPDMHVERRVLRFPDAAHATQGFRVTGGTLAER
jgi:Ca-activated chloride channel family protein